MACAQARVPALTRSQSACYALGTGVADGAFVRVAFVTETYPPELNGVAGTVARAVDGLRARGHSVHLVRPRQAGEARCDTIDEWRVPGLPLPMYRALRIGLPVMAGLARRWQVRRPDVVHVATEGPLGWAACRAGRTLGLPVTSDLRTNFDLYSDYYGFGFMRRLVSRYLRYFHNATDRTFVPTGALAAQLRNDGFWNLQVIGRGVDEKRFSPVHRSEELRRQWGVQVDDPVALHVGRLAAEKNLPLVLRAFAAMRECRPRARLVMVGDGPLRRTLERSAGPGVHFAGELRGDRLAAHYASGDVFLFPSLTETFGNVTLEALASGLIVVAYDMAAASVHIEHGVSGLLAQPGDEQQFIEHGRRAVSAAGWDSMRAAARHAAAAASWDAIVGQYEQALSACRYGTRRPTPAYAA